MANVLNRTTKEFRRSVNTPNFPVADWIINPDISAVHGQPTKYWEITGDTVSLADAPTRAAIDAAAENAIKDGIADELDRTRTIMRAFAEVVLDEINALRGQHALAPRTLAQLKTSVRSKL